MQLRTAVYRSQLHVYTPLATSHPPFRYLGRVTFFFGMLFGAIGSGYLVYAKRSYSATYAVAGGLLILFPYFVSGVVLTLIVGALLVASPKVLETYLG